MADPLLFFYPSERLSCKWQCCPGQLYWACVKLIHPCLSVVEHTLKALRTRLCARRSGLRKIKYTRPLLLKQPTLLPQKKSLLYFVYRYASVNVSLWDFFPPSIKLYRYLWLTKYIADFLKVLSDVKMASPLPQGSVNCHAIAIGSNWPIDSRGNGCSLPIWMENCLCKNIPITFTCCPRQWQKHKGRRWPFRWDRRIEILLTYLSYTFFLMLHIFSTCNPLLFLRCSG